MTRKILVSLVSDQTIPNVLLARELKGIEHYIFVTTIGMEKKERSNHIVQALDLQKKQYTKITVQEDSLEDVESKLQENCQVSDEYIVNLTGGTKLMSIGLFNFFKELKSIIYYIPGGKNVYRQVYPKTEIRENYLEYRTNLKEYLLSYGIDIHKKSYKQKNTLIKPSEYTIALKEKYLSKEIDITFLDELRKIRKIEKLNIDDFNGLADFLESIDFKTTEDGVISKKETEYLTGGWFEEYIYKIIMDDFNLSDLADMIGINLSISNRNVQNEFDIMYLLNNQLNVIECKTGVFDSITQRNITNEALYKLAALKKDFGLFAQMKFYTLSSKGKETIDIRQVYFDRASILGIQIIDKENIVNNL